MDRLLRLGGKYFEFPVIFAQFSVGFQFPAIPRNLLYFSRYLFFPKTQ